MGYSTKSIVIFVLLLVAGVIAGCFIGNSIQQQVEAADNAGLLERSEEDGFIGLQDVALEEYRLSNDDVVERCVLHLKHYLAMRTVILSEVGVFQELAKIMTVQGFEGADKVRLYFCYATVSLVEHADSQSKSAVTKDYFFTWSGGPSLGMMLIQKGTFDAEMARISQ